MSDMTETMTAAEISISDYPENFIPGGGRVFVGVDAGSPDGDCVVKGFYKNGEFHLQSVEHSPLAARMDSYAQYPDRQC